MFPALYHAHHSHYLDDLPFWGDLALSQDGPYLELGCGTGRLLIPLMRYGLRVWGLDNSFSMLRFLQSQLEPQEIPQAPVFQADLASFHLGMNFGLIFLPCNTLSTLAPETRRAAFACAWRHLRPGGLFAASLPNPSLYRRLPRRSDPELEESFPHPVDREPVQVSSAWERDAQFFTVFWHYDHLLPDGQVERHSALARHYLTPVQDYLAELQEAGLQVVQQYGDFDRSPYSPDAPSWIFIARAG